jgi:hypothetical protein
MDFIFWTVAICKIDLKRRGGYKHLGADSTRGLFWKRGGRGQDKMFKMLDKYDRSSDAGRQGFYFLIFFFTDVWCCMDVIANIFDFNVIVFSMLIGWSPRKKWFRISSKEWTSLGGPQGYYHKISCFFYIRVHKILYVGDKCMYTYTYNIYIYILPIQIIIYRFRIFRCEVYVFFANLTIWGCGVSVTGTT